MERLILSFFCLMHQSENKSPERTRTRASIVFLFSVSDHATRVVDSGSDSGRETPSTSSPMDINDDKTSSADKTSPADSGASSSPASSRGQLHGSLNVGRDLKLTCHGSAPPSTAPPAGTSRNVASTSGKGLPATGKSGRDKSVHGDGGNAGQPTAFRPGRLTPLEILERLYPYQRRAVLELVLQGCNGDLVKAIEHFLSAQDTVMAQQQAAIQQQQQHQQQHQQQQHHHHHHHQQPQNHHLQAQQPHPQQPQQQHFETCRPGLFLNGVHGSSQVVAAASSSSSSPSSTNASSAVASSVSPLVRPGMGVGGKFGSASKLTYAGLKSAFTPLSAAAAAAVGGNGLHSAFSPHLSSLSAALPGLHTADALRSSLLQHHTTGQFLPHATHHPSVLHHYPGLASATDLLSATPTHLAYAGFGSLGLGPTLPGMMTPPYAFHPYRLPLGRLSSTPPSARTPDKNSDRSVVTDSDQVSDGWEEGSSPREMKETD